MGVSAVPSLSTAVVKLPGETGGHSPFLKLPLFGGRQKATASFSFISNVLTPGACMAYVEAKHEANPWITVNQASHFGKRAS